MQIVRASALARAPGYPCRSAPSVVWSVGSSADIRSESPRAHPSRLAYTISRIFPGPPSTPAPFRVFRLFRGYKSVARCLHLLIRLLRMIRGQIWAPGNPCRSAPSAVGSKQDRNCRSVLAREVWSVVSNKVGTSLRPKRSKKATKIQTKRSGEFPLSCHVLLRRWIAAVQDSSPRTGKQVENPLSLRTFRSLGEGPVHARIIQVLSWGADPAVFGSVQFTRLSSRAK